MAVSVTVLLLEQCLKSCEDESDMVLAVTEGKLRCHWQLLSARCPALDVQSKASKAFDSEDRAVVQALLQWIYTGKMDLKLVHGREAEISSDRVAQLAQLLGMRDLVAMRQRLLRSWRREPSRGCIEPDLLRAYDQRSLSNTWFLCDAEGDGQLVYAGFLPLLAKASSFFSAMLSSRWTEKPTGSNKTEFKVGWDASVVERMIRFLHGGPSFVRNSHDLDQAAHCADFFGMPCLLAQSHNWIIEHLDRETAPRLWSYVESQPRLCLDWFQDRIFNEDTCMDADDACFDFHIQEFSAMADGDLDNWIPLFDLTPSLMFRLVASGGLDVHTSYLKLVISKFVCHKAPQEDQKATLRKLLPPAVLFNRELRDQVLGRASSSLRDFM